MNQAAVLKNRISSIDIVRGIVMIIMALDHTRDFFHSEAMTDDPTNMATTTPVLFFTRWITHYCAPVFVFLAGTSAYLSGLKRSKAELSSFLIKRGVWLVLIEIIVITFGWTFNPFFNLIILQVIWAIGISMIILGLLIHLPFPVIFAIGLAIVAGHNLLDPYEAAAGQEVNIWLSFAHQAFFTPYTIFSNHTVLVVYAFLPWTGIMALGYCFGKLFTPGIDAAKRRRVLVLLGLGLIVLFVGLRANNGYGDPAPWSQQKSGVYTFLSFLNVTKYPPSLMFTCMTLGPAIILIALLEKVKNKFTDFANIFGRVPFFYYVLHFYVLHIILVAAFFIAGYGAGDIASQQQLFFFRPNTFGYPLWGTYIVWISVIIILYPLCRWYNRYKSTHKHWWLSYL